jgi:hypothetical protein
VIFLFGDSAVEAAISADLKRLNVEIGAVSKQRIGQAWPTATVLDGDRHRSLIPGI